MDARLSNRHRLRAKRTGLGRLLVAVVLIASLTLLTACSSSSGKKSNGKVKPPAVTALVRWKQCLARHGVKLPTAQHTKKASFTRAQLIRALRRSKVFRAKFAAALLRTPPGVQESIYKTAAIACSPPAGRAAA
jgi:hypothetical protein